MNIEVLKKMVEKECPHMTKQQRRHITAQILRRNSWAVSSIQDVLGYANYSGVLYALKKPADAAALKRIEKRLTQ